MAGLSLSLSGFAAANVNLKNVEFSSQPGGRFEIRLDFDAPPPEPKGYNIEKWMEFDMEYIDHWSLWLDLNILIKTIPAVLRNSGAA